MPLIGAHVSAAGGPHNVFEHAAAIGAEAIQMFGASPRQWAAPLPSDASVKLFRSAWEKSGVKEIYLHAPYLINIADPRDDAQRKSTNALSAHMAIAHALGVHGVIFHVGSSKDSPKAEAIERVASCMKEILEKNPGHTQLIIENSAGGGGKIASTPAEIGALMQCVGSDRVKVCIDTAHAFEAGLIQEFTSAHIKKMFDECDDAFGSEHIVALHVNDSKSAFNSHHDRHENIGEGYIGLDGFKNLAKEKRIAKTSWLLEVPGFDSRGPDKKNVDLLKSCFT